MTASTVVEGPIHEYEERHYSENVEDIGVAFDGTHIWVCLNGLSLLRAKVFQGKLLIEYTSQEGERTL